MSDLLVLTTFPRLQAVMSKLQAVKREAGDDPNDLTGLRPIPRH